MAVLQVPTSLDLYALWSARKAQKERLNCTESHCFGNVTDTLMSVLREEEAQSSRGR